MSSSGLSQARPRYAWSWEGPSPWAELRPFSSSLHFCPEPSPWGHSFGGSHTCCCWWLWSLSPIQVSGLVWSLKPSVNGYTVISLLLFWR